MNISTSQVHAAATAAEVTSERDDVTTTTVTVPLWVPYVVLTGVILILIMISFVRFHILRDREHHETTQQPTADDHTGPPSDVIVTSSTAPGYLNTFRAFTEEPTPAGNINGSRPRVGAVPSESAATMTSSKSDGVIVQLLSAGRRRLRQAMTQHKRSLPTRSYTINVNGSMVDVQCSVADCREIDTSFTRLTSTSGGADEQPIANRRRHYRDDPECISLNDVTTTGSSRRSRHNWDRRPPTANELLLAPPPPGGDSEDCATSSECGANYESSDEETLRLY